MNNKKNVKALLLLSGGLDSMLAGAILKRENIEVTAIKFVTGLEFAVIKNELLDAPKDESAQKVADFLGIELRVVPLRDIYLDMFLKPKYGYGSAINPCLDCHILMLTMAYEIMQKEGFDFIATGEVKGQRPMSQKARDLDNAAKDSGLGGYLLRPLSAKVLPETIVEKEKLIDREKLYGIEGKSREMQLKLVKEFGITEFASPAGAGCSIVDKGYARKYNDLIAHQGTDKLNMDILRYLAVGRHIRLDENHKLILGRDEAENDALEKRNDARAIILIPQYIKGPLGFIEIYADEIDENVVKKAAGIIAHYSKEELQEFPMKAYGVNIDYNENIILAKKDSDFIQIL